MFVSAGSASTQATSPGASAASSASRSLSSTTFVVSAGSTGGPTLPGANADRAVVAQRRERLVDGAVVAAVEDEDLRPARDRAADPDRKAVRVGRAERELPERQPEAPRELLPGPGRVLGRQHRGDPGRSPLGDGADDRRRAHARPSHPCRRGRGRRTRGRRRRRRARRAPRPGRAGTGRPSASSTSSGRRRAASRGARSASAPRPRADCGEAPRPRVPSAPQADRGRRRRRRRARRSVTPASPRRA